MRPARIIAAVIFATIIAVTGCTAPTNADQPSPPPTHRTDPTPLDRQAPIYAAVLRQYLTSGDAAIAAEYRFPRIFVLDHAVAGADPFGQGASGGAPIPAVVRRAVTRSLADVGPLSFVPSGEAVIVRGSCGQVRDRGILITLGSVDGVGDQVQVGHLRPCLLHCRQLVGLPGGADQRRLAGRRRGLAGPGRLSSVLPGGREPGRMRPQQPNNSPPN